MRTARPVPDRPLDEGADVGLDALTAPIPVTRPAGRPGAHMPGPRTGEAPARRPLVPLG